MQEARCGVYLYSYRYIHNNLELMFSPVVEFVRQMSCMASTLFHSSSNLIYLAVLIRALMKQDGFFQGSTNHRCFLSLFSCNRKQKFTTSLLNMLKSVTLSWWSKTAKRPYLDLVN